MPSLERHRMLWVGTCTKTLVTTNCRRVLVAFLYSQGKRATKVWDGIILLCFFGCCARLVEYPKPNSEINRRTGIVRFVLNNSDLCLTTGHGQPWVCRADRELHVRWCSRAGRVPAPSGAKHERRSRGGKGGASHFFHAHVMICQSSKHVGDVSR